MGPASQASPFGTGAFASEASRQSQAPRAPAFCLWGHCCLHGPYPPPCVQRQQPPAMSHQPPRPMTVTICLEDIRSQASVPALQVGRVTFGHLYHPLTSPAHICAWNGVWGRLTLCLCVSVMLSDVSLLHLLTSLSVCLSPCLSPPPPHDCFLILLVLSLVSGRLPSYLSRHFMARDFPPMCLLRQLSPPLSLPPSPRNQVLARGPPPL